MVEAPERIWANPTSRTPLPVKDGKKGTWLAGVWPTWGAHGAGNVEYLRSDIAERQIAELRAKLDEYKEVAHNRTAAWTAAEAENARLRALPLKDEVGRVLERHWNGRYFGMTDDNDAQEINALLSRLRAGDHVEIDPDELVFADLRASGGVFPEFYGPSSASDAELAQAHDDMDTLGVPRQERGHTMSLAARVYWLAKQRIDALRAGEQEGWRTLNSLPEKGLVIVGCYNGKGQWCAEVANVDYVREHLSEIVSGVFSTSPHLAFDYTHWMPLPAAPSEQRGDQS